MIIKRGIVYKKRLHIRIPFDRGLDNITICEKVKCKYAVIRDGDEILSVGDSIDCVWCDHARSRFTKRYKYYQERHYSYVPYDN